MKKYILLLLLLCLSMLAFAACTADADADLPTNDASQDVAQENLPAPDSHPILEATEHPSETEEISTDFEFNACVKMKIRFDSLIDLEQHILASRDLDPTAEIYPDYSMMNLAEMQYYYVPKTINTNSGYTLTSIEKTPYVLTLSYVQDTTGMVVVFDIVKRMESEDPFEELERRYGQRPSHTGHVFVADSDFLQMYYMADDNYMVCASFQYEWYKANGYSDAMAYWGLLENCEVKQVKIKENVNHVTE